MRSFQAAAHAQCGGVRLWLRTRGADSHADKTRNDRRSGHPLRYADGWAENVRHLDSVPCIIENEVGLASAAPGRRQLFTQSMVHREHAVTNSLGVNLDARSAPAGGAPQMARITAREIDSRCRHQGGQSGHALLRASCPAPCGPACGCSKSLQAILNSGSNTTSVVPSRR